MVHDPKALANAARVYPTLTYVEDLAEALANAELVLHLTEWPEYREFDPTTLRSSPRQRHLIDARNRLDPVVWRAAGWTYRALGRPTA